MPIPFPSRPALAALIVAAAACAHPGNAEARFCGGSSSYLKDAAGVVFKSSHTTPTDGMDADPDVRVRGADAASFETVPVPGDALCGSPWGRDGAHVYHRGVAMSDYPASFRLVRTGVPGFPDVHGEDGRNIYIEGNAIPAGGTRFVDGTLGAPGSNIMRNVGTKYFVSPAGVYTAEGIRTPADPGSFEILGCDLTRDKTRAYVAGRPLDGVDAASLHAVAGRDPDQCYFADTKRVYWSGLWCVGGCSDRLLAINGADPATYFVTPPTRRKPEDLEYPQMFLKTWNATPVEWTR